MKRLRKLLKKTKLLLQSSVNMQRRDYKKMIIIFTDASQLGWAVVASQLPEVEVNCTNYEKIKHEPLAFLSGTFDGASKNWAIVEKEAYAIIIAIDRLDYLLYDTKPFILYCDHWNLIFYFRKVLDSRKPQSIQMKKYNVGRLYYKGLII